MTTRTLITGGSGFIGRHVVASLARRGIETHTCARRADAAPGVPHHRVELTSPGAADELLARVRPGRLLHLAWAVEPGQYWHAPRNEDWREASLWLGRAASRHGVERFVGVGTCAEYDLTHEPGRPRREDDPLGADNAYGRAKLQTFGALARLFARSPTRFAWARLFHLHGEGEAEGRLGSALRRAANGGPAVTLATPRALRDYADVRDIAEALARLLLGDPEGAVNLASGRPRAIADVAAEIAGDASAFDASSAAGEGDILTADVTRARAWGLIGARR